MIFGDTMQELPRFTLPAFGISFESVEPLPGFRRGTAPPGVATVQVVLGDGPHPGDGWEEHGEEVWVTAFGGHRFAVCAGADGDHLFTYAGARFHLSARADRLTCVPGEAPPVDWQRVLLDTVFHCVGLIHGGVALHASAVEFDGRAVAVVSASGSGKTTLAAELIRRGGCLLSDDILFLRGLDGKTLGAPGPPLMNLPLGAEIEGVTTQLEHFGDEPESWASVDRASSTDVPVAAVFLLHRGVQHPEAQIRPLLPVPFPILAHMVFLPHLGGERSRFLVASDLASTSRLFALETDMRTAPRQLARLVEEAAGA